MYKRLTKKYNCNGRTQKPGIVAGICLSLLFIYAGSSFGQDLRVADQVPIAELEGKAAQRRLEKISNYFSKTAASSNFNIQKFRCEWKINPAVRYISGAVTAYFKLSSSNNQLIFDLVDNLTVDSVYYHSSSIGFSRPQNHTVEINLSANPGIGVTDSVTIYYQGVPPTGGGFGSFINEIHAGVPVNWTLSEPYGAREWWPCKNGLTDKTDSIDIYLTTPEAYTGVSNGLLQNEVVADGQRTTYWKHRYPIATYLVAIATTNYKKLEDTVQLGQKVLPFIQYAYPESANSFKNGTTFARKCLRLFHNTFGDYPFINEKYGHTQFSWGGGMEHQTNSFMISVAENLVAHEAAHQWFGDKITCGSWQHIWLNEGFATYLTNFYFENFSTPASYRSLLTSQLSSITAIPNGSVFVPDTTSVGRIFSGRLTYNKGAWLLHMLRWKLGDESFFKGLRAYLEDPALKYGYAITDDLIRNLEKESGISLDEFFADWFYGEGHPSYQLQWQSLGSGLINTTLSQTTSNASVSFFEMPVPVRFKNDQRDTMIVIDHRQNQQRSYIKLGFAPDSAFIDPDLKLISANNTVTRLPDAADGPSAVIVFPNPVLDNAGIITRNFSAGNYSFRLINSVGQILWSKSMNGMSGTNITSIPMGNLPRGIYWLSITDGKSLKLVKKLLK